MNGTAGVLAGALLVAGTAAAQTYTPYSEWRQTHPSINAAVAAMPSSDIHGAFNRVSAILERGNVSGLGSGDGYDETLLPANFHNGMTSAVFDVREDYKDGALGLALDHRYALIQVADVVVVQRNEVLFHQDFPCSPSPEHPCPPLPPTVGELNQLAGTLRGTLAACIDYYNEHRGPLDPYEPPPPSPLTYANYSAAMDRVRLTYGYIRGVESIDYE